MVLLAGPDVTVRSVGELQGRATPFDGLPSAMYVPPDWRVELEARGPTQVAVAWAPPVEGRPVARRPLIVTPQDVRVETRGAGNATRQINHIIEPSFPAARLLAVEVLTPSGNWSSWPPHKHDVDDLPGEAVLEEVYHYRFARPDAWGMQRVYRRGGARFARDGPLDATFEVRDGDVVIVPDGYHPFVAAHGDDAYYLNALAGEHRTMACSFDPALAWVAQSWAEMETDPRVPLVARPAERTRQRR